MELLNREQRAAIQKASSEWSVIYKGTIQTTFLKLHYKENNFVGAKNLNVKVKIFFKFEEGVRDEKVRNWIVLSK